MKKIINKVGLIKLQISQDQSAQKMYGSGSEN